MKSNLLARESLWGTIISYLGMGIGFVTTFFVQTAYLSPEEVGLTRILVELATLLSGFAMLGLSTSISRYFPYFIDERPMNEQVAPHRGFFYWLMVLTASGLFISLIAYALGADVMNAYLDKGSALLSQYKMYVLPLIVFIALWTVVELYSIQLMRLAIPRVIRELVLRLLLLVCYGAYAIGWVQLDGFVLLFVLSYGLCMLLSFVYLGRITDLSLKREVSFPTAEIKRNFCRYTTLALISVLGTTLATRMDVLVLSIAPSAGLRSTAVFSIGFFIVSIVEIPTRAMIGLATAQIARLMKDEQFVEVRRLYEQVASYQLLSSLIIYLAIYVSIDSLILLMPNAEAYQGSRDVFIVLGVGKLIEVYFTACHPIINTSKYYQWSLYYTLFSVLVALIGSIYFVSLWGTVGAAVATVTTTLLGYALLQFVVWKRIGLHPISPRLVKILSLGLLLWGGSFVLPEWDNLIVNILLRSGAIFLIAISGVWLFNLAPEAKAFILKSINTRCA